MLDTAVGLEESLRVDLDAMIHDAATDQRLRTAYVGCWGIKASAQLIWIVVPSAGEPR